MPIDTTNETFTGKTSALVWTVQSLLTVLFIVAGGAQLAAPMAALAQQSPLSPLLLRFIGLTALAGALGPGRSGGGRKGADAGAAR
jgi:hypothetical protein